MDALQRLCIVPVVILLVAAVALAGGRVAPQDSRCPLSRPAAPWTPRAIKEDPHGFVAYAIELLRERNKAAESELIVLRSDLATLDRLKQENESKLNSISTKLEAFKESFHTVGGVWPRSVAGRAYDEPAFMKEVEGLLAEGTVVAIVYDKAGLAAAELDEKIRSLAMRIQHYQAARSVLEEVKSLIEKPLPSSLERILVSTHESMSSWEERIDAAAIKSLPELMQAASRRSRPTAAEFLSRKPESRK